MASVPLRVTGGSKSFRRHGRVTPVFQSLDLTVEDAEILVLLGPSGCGKSTLLRIIAGLDHLDDGELQLAMIDGDTPDVGIVFQQPLLLPWLTVRENVELGLRYRANKGVREPGIVERTLAEFGIATLSEAYPDELSGGQAQRVSFARTVVTRPSIVLLDEPFGALDPSTRQSMQNWLLEVQSRLGLTVLLVTHDVDEAIRLGHRVVLMAGSPGRIHRTWDVSGGGPNDGFSARVREEVLGAYGSIDAPPQMSLFRPVPSPA